MPRFLLLLLLMSPAVATGPTVEQMLHAYVHAGWEPAMKGQERMVCINAKASVNVDKVVSMIAERAKSICS